MPPRRYAQDTTVSVDTTQSEIRTLLRKHGSTQFALYEGETVQAVQFTLKGVPYRFTVEYPSKEWADGETSMSSYYAKYDQTVENIRRKEWMRRWRARLLWLKATLEFAQGEDEGTLPSLMGSFAVLADGQTVGEAIRHGNLPLLAPGG